MLRVGMVGCGFMGRMHYSRWSAIDGVEVTAICHTDPDRLKMENGASGNIEGTDAGIEFNKLNLYSNFGEMLAESSLDAVSITLPTDLHAEFSIKALEAGLHVICEKPMALNVAQCDDMIAAAKCSGRILQIGHCIRFWPEYARAKEMVDGAEYGKVVAATFRRLGSIPTWSRSNWFKDEGRSGGMALDLHIHDTDYVQYLLGRPRAVRSFGAESLGLGLTHVVTQYLYGDDSMITGEGSWQMMPSFGFEMSFNIEMEKATLVYDNTREPAFKLCPLVGKAFTPAIEKGDGYSLEIAHFAKAIRGEKIKEVTTLEQSRNSVRIVAAEKESAQTGKRISLE